MKKISAFVLIFSCALASPCPVRAGWNPGPEKKQSMVDNAEASLQKFKDADPALKKFFDKAYGYAIFPTVGKGGILIGGAYGEGVVYESNNIIGHTSLTQVSVGFQWGGQAYSELIFFKDRETLDAFKSGKYELGAAASAVAITLGASADAEFNYGLSIFTLAKGGLMYEAIMSGQKFKYWNYE